MAATPVEVLSCLSPDAIGMKREEEEKTSVWKKVAFIAIGVAFVGMFIFSYWSPFIGTFLRTVQPLDTLSVQFTIRDEGGQAVLTTDRAVYQTAIKNGNPVFFTNILEIQAGKTGSPAIMGVQAINPYLGQAKFGLLGLEIDEMSVGLLGMHAGETRRVDFRFEDPLMVNLTAREFDVIGGNFSQSQVGDWIPVGFSEDPLARDLPGANETPADTVVRMARIVEKTGEGALLSYRYASSEISFAEFPR